MKEEIRRIMQLVHEGKLSPEDAADLIDAFTSESEPEDQPEEPAEGAVPPPPPVEDEKDPFKHFVEFMEGLGKEVNEIDWKQVAGQVRQGAKKGVDSIKQNLDQIKQGKIGFGWWNAHETKEVSLPLVIPSGKTLRVESRSGDVRVSGGFENPTVSAKATVRGSDPEDAKKKADEYTLIVEESDHVVLIRQPNVSGVSVDLVIQVATVTNIEVRTESGDVMITDTGGGAKISTMSGDLKVRGLTGTVEISTQTGDIAVDDCANAMVTVENKSGDIAISKSSGTLNVRAASGDVALLNCGGKSISVESVTGDVNVELSEPTTGMLNVRTVNGDARVALHPNSDCRVSLSTLRGSVESGAKLEDEARQEQRITGRLGAGSGTVDVSAVNGDIYLGVRAMASSG